MHLILVQIALSQGINARKCWEVAQRDSETANNAAPVSRTKSRRVHGKVKATICESIDAYLQLDMLS
ncbi:hypothetical protein BDN70DRAFT_878891 [Pholiota conissans]|uniref:Uncharacterized protein n=1 Tax=Pholiota conissans TaxID=109636 RepID=A0A9P5Z0T6_9AGAR|nr:hypothetical protein BDN70DRAFT_878891 [Pholiota conissans]